MKENQKLKYKAKLNLNNGRLTKPRRALLEILENKHLSFKEIKDILQKKGFLNVATIYNNLYYLINKNIISTLFLDGIVYYEVIYDNPKHIGSSKIHVIDSVTGKITEIKSYELLTLIRENQEISEFNIDNIEVIIKGTPKIRKFEDVDLSILED